MVNMSIPKDSCRLPGILCDIVSYFGYVAWKTRKVGQFLTISSVSAFMLTQYMDSHASSIVFSLTLCFGCSCFSALSCIDASIIILLPFTLVLSVSVISSLNDQYACRFLCMSALIASSEVQVLTACLCTCHLVV